MNRFRFTPFQHPRSSRRPLVLGLLALAMLQVATAAFAVRPEKWLHTTEDDFASGEARDVVVGSLGDVRMSAASEKIAEASEDATIIYDMIRTEANDLYVAVGPKGKLLKQEAEDLTVVLELEEEQLFCLALHRGALLMGISGDGTSRLAVLEDGAARTIADLSDARYLWDMVVDGDDIYVATGTDGHLLRVETAGAQPKVTVLLDAEQDNLLCLGRDGAGRLYAGSDSDGLVYRVSIDEMNEASTFVLYDATEPEIGALLVEADGTVFAGTADAKQAKPGRLKAASKESRGRPAQKKKDEAGEPAAEAEPDEPQPDAPAPVEPDMEQDATEMKEVAPQDEQAPAPQEQEPASQPQGRLPLLAPDRAALMRRMTASKPTGAKPTAPSAAQHDELRSLIRKQLEAARDTGKIQQAQAGEKPLPKAAKKGSVVRPAPPSKKSKGSKKGNAIYRIGADGFVREIFRESVMILSLARLNDGLLVGTGSEGQLYNVDALGDQKAIMADLAPQQLTAMLGDGPDVLLGTSNPAELRRYNGGYAREGVFTSKVLDASQISLWGRLHMRGRTPPRTSVGVETRAGNVEDPEKAPWSPWAKAVVLDADEPAAPLAANEFEVSSPPGRFLQYRLNLASDGEQMPAVEQVELSYVTPNLRPQVKSIKAAYAGAGKRKSGGSSSAGKTAATRNSDLKLEWKASDPNGDELTYELEYRHESSERWLPLADELTASRYKWKTQLVPDGRYLVRVTASDRANNTPGMELSATRLSDPVAIDNSPADFRDLQHHVQGRRLTVTGVVADAGTAVSRISYMVDGEEPWHPVLPKDMIYDSTREAFVVTIDDLEPGFHAIVLRAVDAQNNTRHEWLHVKIP